MADNKSGKDIPGEGHKTETHGTVEIMITAGTEEINKSHKRNFDEFTKKLEATEEPAAKISKTNEGEKIMRFFDGESSVDDGTVSLHVVDMDDAKTATRKCEEFSSKERHKSLVQNLKTVIQWNKRDHPEKDVSDMEALLQMLSIEFSNE
ncbi:unnamed protein product [Caenorhabditis nigoni]|uniref:Uncharacterized protein n=1 Tax=Caenorhabditis nigoni TaxID=1611254 RepID=A0A2G5T392_9PELO|nr:hypothetical protein B9Z55_026548 [Caenorhabditis nigoni]